MATSPDTSEPDLSLGVLGADGRMGREVVRLIAHDDALSLAAAFTHEGSDALGADAGELAGARRIGVAVEAFSADALAGCDVLVDFSTPGATRAALLAMQVSPCQALVTGTTGQTVAQLRELDDLAAGLAVLRAGNFSLGVNLMEALVERAAAALGPDYDIEVDEAHHRRKVDAPSGTAILLGEAAGRGRGVEFAPSTDRNGPREAGAIGLSVRRAGGIVGDHEVSFTDARERLAISHRAFDRSLFASGALAAARWIAGRGPGRYTMRDVLGLD